MSDLPGGPAGKAGANYEALWGVRAMLALLHGHSERMRVEEPRVEGAEFYVERPEGREYWQAKRQLLSQNTWSLNRLSSEGVLSFFLQQARVGHRCVFASITDAPELRTLACRARDSEAGGLAEFVENFVSDRTWRLKFAELRRLWDNCSEDEAFETLKCIEVRVEDDLTLTEHLCDILSVMFAAPGSTALDALRGLYGDSAHKVLTAETVRDYLRAREIHPRTLEVEDSLLSRIASLTETYLAGQRMKLIRGELIPRAVAQSVVQKITESINGLDLLITGAAGNGKSGCLFEIVTDLVGSNIPVIAFRLDRIQPVHTPAAIGAELNLPESPAVVLARAFPKQKVVLVVDQLDFVSTTSGRHPDFFDAVAALIAEVRGLRAESEIHLILTCRQFDFDHDARLRSLLPKSDSPHKLAELTESEVKSVLAAEGVEVATITAPQLKLLLLPQNLALFIDAGLARQTRPSFVTQKELFDAYWQAKHTALAADFPVESAEWKPIIEALTREMNSAQELSVPKARLDRFSPRFLSRMVSSGVLTFDRNRYGFGHESFFDYCFARTFSSGEQELHEFLEADAQHLFRRAQTRQVLVYLREDEPGRYVQNVGALLENQGIRFHLKLLVVELLASFPDPRDDEWDLLLPRIESELAAISSGKRNPDKLASRTFDAFRASRRLFPVADRRGDVDRWLNSSDDAVANATVTYLRWQLHEHADRIAELIEPFADSGGEWALRLRYLMEGHDLEQSRRYFDLFLRLLDDGTLDDARDRFASNGTFWSMLYSLAKERPDWCAEVAAHWLDRQVAEATRNRPDEKSPSISMHDDSGVHHLFESARGAPDTFLRHVLPSVVRAAEATSYDVDGGLKRDTIWTYRITGEYISLETAYLSASEIAFEIIAKEDPERLRPHIITLLATSTYTSNSLLLSAYLEAPEHFAEEAISLLCREPERLRCGYSDSSHWISKCLIEKCSPHCARSTFSALEGVLVEYTTPYERSAEGAEVNGRASFTLLSALAPARRSPATEERIAALAARFGAPDSPPRGVRSYTVVSPIPEEAAVEMTDDEWLASIAEYNSCERHRDWEHPEKGGAHELAAMMQPFVQRDPERFARLALRFPSGTEPAYLMNVLYGLKDARLSVALKIEVARKAVDSPENACVQAAVDLLSRVQDEVLPADAIAFLARCATEHPNPARELWRADKESDVAYYGGDILTAGINTVRGRAAEAIRDLIFANRHYLDEFAITIERLVRDPSVSVRACAASTLLAVAVHDTALAISLFGTLAEGDDVLLGTHFVEDFIRRGLGKHLPVLRKHIQRMLKSADKQVRQTGARLALLAHLSRDDADDLASAALNGDTASRLGVAEIAEYNLTNPVCRERCERILRVLFNDEDSTVKQAAAKCFWHLWQKPDVPLIEYEELIDHFVASRAFVDSPTYLLHALDDSRRALPGVVLDVCEDFVNRCSDLARDIRTHHAGDEHTVGPLVFRAYQQLSQNPLQIRALNLIDRMCEEGLTSAAKNLLEFER